MSKLREKLNEKEDWSYVQGKIDIFIKNYKQEYPDSDVYQGARIKEVVSWNPLKVITKGGAKTTFKGDIINALYGGSDKEFVVLVLKRNEGKIQDIIVMGTENGPLPLKDGVIKGIK